jgi:integrase
LNQKGSGKNQHSLFAPHTITVDTDVARLAPGVLWLSAGRSASDAPLWVSLATNGTRGKRLSTRAIEQICQDRLGTGKAHVLRHSFARALEDAGAKVSEIQSRLGHESLATTGRYLAALRADENPHADALAALFGLDTE